MKNIEVKLEINSCDKCPFHKVTKSYSTDGWDRVEDWECKKVGKVIAKMIDNFEKVAIPKWCPYGENIEEVDVFEFLEKNDLELVIKSNLTENKKITYQIFIRDLDVLGINEEGDEIPISYIGRSVNPNVALEDYISKISNKKGVFDYFLPNKRYIDIPTLKFNGEL